MNFAKLEILVITAVLFLSANALAEKYEVGASPYGPEDEVGALNEVSDTMIKQALSSVVSGQVYDLAVEFFYGMPGPQMFEIGVPAYHKMFPMVQSGYDQMIGDWMPAAAPDGVSYMDEVVLLSLHAGTQIDALSHISYRGRIFNNFNTKDDLDLHGWKRAGVEKIPPIVTNGILLDVAAAKGVSVLAESYGIGPQDLQDALDRQGIEIEKGDAVLIRTGRMTLWPDAEAFYAMTPGLTTEGARWLVERGAVVVGADNVSVEREPNDPISAHMYLLGQAGVNLIEQMWLEDLARDQVYEFAFVAVPLKFRGGTGSPIRPIAIPQ